MILLIALGASEGFWQTDTIVGAALEAENAEVEESTPLTRLEARVKRRNERNLQRRSTWLIDARRLPQRVARRSVSRPVPTLRSEGPRASGRALLHEQRRLLI